MGTPYHAIQQQIGSDALRIPESGTALLQQPTSCPETNVSQHIVKSKLVPCLP